MGQDPRNPTDQELSVGPITSYQVPPTLPPVPTSPVERRLFIQELVRAGLAIVLALILLIVILLAFLSIRPFNEIRELLEIFVPVLVTLLGGSGTFYYIDRDRR